jgi:hypothetical protein
VNSPSKSEGPLSPRRAERSAAAGPADAVSTWPVLARLPRAGGRPATPDAAATTTPADDESAMLESASIEHDAPPIAPPAAAEPRFRRRYRAPRHVQLNAAATAGDFEGAYSTDVEAAPSTLGRPADVARRRVDAPHASLGRSSSSADDRRPAEAGRASLPSQLFGLYAKAAPHSGLLGAAVMLIVAGALCWITFSQQPAALNYDDALELPGGWPAETTSQAPALDEETSATETAQGFVREFSWRKDDASADKAAAGDAIAPPPIDFAAVDAALAAAQAGRAPAAPAPVAIAVAPASEAPPTTLPSAEAPQTAAAPPTPAVEPSAPATSYPATAFSTFEPLDVAGRPAADPTTAR